MPFSGENATIAYHLQFGVPSEDDSFMRYMMNEELVRGVLLQSLHDEGVSGCETLGLGPASLLLYGKWRKSGGQTCGLNGRTRARAAGGEVPGACPPQTDGQTE